MRRTPTFLFVILSLCAACASVWAESAATALANIQLNGLIASTYSYSLNNPANDSSAYRAFDQATGKLIVETVTLVVQRPYQAPNESGFRIDWAFGRAAEMYGSGLGHTADIDIQQAFFGHRFSNQATLDVGKFATHLGYEITEGGDGINLNATRGLQFAFSLPGTHTGIRWTHPVSENTRYMLSLSNGWDVDQDNNRSATVGAQFSHAWSERFTTTMNYVGGPENPDDSKHYRHLGEILWSYQPGNWALAGYYDYGRDENPTGDRTIWSCAGLFYQRPLNEQLELAVRAETFYDPDAFRIGSTVPKFTLSGVTVTPIYHLDEQFTVRLDLRHDVANAKVFLKNNELISSQNTATVSASYHF